MSDERDVLAQVLEASDAFLNTLDTRSTRAEHDVDRVATDLGGPLPDDGTDPRSVLDQLVRDAEPGLLATPSGRFFGWVIGGTLPAALGADWLTSVWDQNAGLLSTSPAAAAAERVAGSWILDLLGLPADAAVGFVTGATMANFTCLAAARRTVLQRVGWDVDLDGLPDAPRVTVIVGAERHDTVDVALRYLGFGQNRSVAVPVDDQGRLRLDGLTEALETAGDGPVIVCLQAGNVNSGSFDPIGAAVDLAHAHGAWVHVDGAFGLWAAASPRLRRLLDGVERADSWATDGHKTLNVPYDSGFAIVADADALHGAMGAHAAYLIQDERPDPMASVPEFSRRARGFAVWAALRSLGRSGVVAMVDGFARHARDFTEQLAQIDGVTIVNQVDFTQVCVSFGDDAVTREVARRLMADGTAWMTPSVWRGQAILRISVSNWRTTDDDVRRTVEAVRRVVGEVSTD